MLVFTGLRKFRFILLSLFLSVFIGCSFSFPPTATAQTGAYTTVDTPRFILYIGAKTPKKDAENIDTSSLAQKSIEVLDATYNELSRIFHNQPQKKVVLRFLPPKEFRERTGAPAWTSAMYFRDEITIPLTHRTGVDRDELERALRHEYTHAVIAELSSYRCPAWLDEGVAQLLEGEANPLLGPALRKWIRVNQAIPLSWLNNGFTTLNSAFVPAAYAQSLFSARKIIQEMGFSAITAYLEHLRDGKPEAKAFFLAFGRTHQAFEKELTVQMRRWASSNRVHP